MARIVALLVVVLGFCLVGGDWLLQSRTENNQRDIIVQGSISHENGYAFTAPVPTSAKWQPTPDSMTASNASTLRLFENERELGPAHSLHDDIRKLGSGRFSHWRQSIYFSSSDNSDPTTNGRRYSFRYGGAEVAGGKKSWVTYGGVGLIGAALAMLMALRIGSSKPGDTVPTLPAWCLLSEQAITRSIKAMQRAAAAVPFAAVALFLALQWTWGRSVIYTLDSLGFLYTGILINTGGDIAGHLGARNIGYPLFAAAVMPLAGFKGLVAVQAVLAAAGLACLLWVTRRLVRPALAFMVIGTALAITIVASDSFVLNIQTVTAEAPFSAALAVTLCLLIEALHQKGPRRAGLLIGCLAAAYLTLLFKPNAILALPFCAAIALTTAAVDLRSFLDRRVLVGAAALAITVVTTQVYQKSAQPKNYDFGTRVLYCGHLDVVLPELGSATSERRNLAAVLTEVRRTPGGWPILGYSADGCFYGAKAYAAIHAAASADHMGDRAWMAQQFRRGVLHHPIIYAGEIWHQTRAYFRAPDPEVDSQAGGVMPDNDWSLISRYPRLVGMDKAEFDVRESSWFATRRHTLPAFGKGVIRRISQSLLVVTAIATALALVNLTLRWRRGSTVCAEVDMLAISAFVLSVVLTTAISFSYDVGRYASTISPLTFVWWFASLTYLATAVLRLVRSRAQ